MRPQKRSLEVKRRKRHRPGRRKVYFRDIYERAIEAKRLRGNREASVAKDLQRVRRLLPLLGHVPVREITAGMVERILQQITQGGKVGGKTYAPVSFSTTNRYHALISSILKWAVRQEYIKANPCSDGACPWCPEQSVHINFLSAEVEGKILEVIRQDCPEKEFEFKLYILTGARRSELYDLKWSGVLPKGMDVEGKERGHIVLLNDAAREVLDEMRRRRPNAAFVTPERETRIRDNRTWLHDAVEKAGLKPGNVEGGISFRTLRHTFASRLADNGTPIKTIQQLLGHKSITMSLKYAHLTDAHLQAAVEKVEMLSPEARRAKKGK